MEVIKMGNLKIVDEGQSWSTENKKLMGVYIIYRYENRH